MRPAEEVATGIFVVKQAIKYKKVNFPVNVYVIAGENGLVFDSGFGTARAGRYLAGQIRLISDSFSQKGKPCSIKKAMTSHGHWDHFSGLAYLQENLGFEILATEKQALKLQSKKNYKKIFWPKPGAPRPTGSVFFNRLENTWRSLFKEAYIRLLRIRFLTDQVRILNENTTLSINNECWQMLSLPGHCDDDVVLYNEKRGILLSGDIVLRSITTWLGPKSSDLEQYMAALGRIENLPNLQLILPAHGSPITNPVQRVREAIDHRNRRTESIFRTVLNASDNGITFEEIFKKFYPRSKRIQRATLGGWIAVTLSYLVKTDKIIQKMNKRDVVFRVNLQHSDQS